MLNRTHFLVLAALAVLSGCKKSENPGSTAAGQTPGAQAQVLHFGNGTEPQDLDPQVVTGVPENKIVNALFEGLVAYGPNGQGTVPAAAERWTISPDGLVYTFFLQPAGTLVKRGSSDRAALCSVLPTTAHSQPGGGIREQTFPCGGSGRVLPGTALGL
jgi:hypothetical protein